jgi:2-polyprenyl-6-methoxyphenol hydroxylase-like FAD-dependent oxidoreductase
MKLNRHAEVLVVGAGPVGMLAALLLGENGIHTQIIDQQSRTATRSYACALHPHSLKLLDEAGVAGDAIDLGWPVETVAFYEGNARRCELRLSDLSAEFPFVLVLPQNELEDFLEKRLEQLPNVSFDWNHSLHDLQMDGQTVTATINKLAFTGKGYGAPVFEKVVEKPFVVLPDFVVGADGHDSMVRRRLNIPFDKTGQPDFFRVYEFEIDGEMGHEMKVVLDGAATSVMWPLGRNRCRWSFQLAPADSPGDFPEKNRDSFTFDAEGDPEKDRQELQRLLGERAPWFNAPVKAVNWETGIQFDHWVARQFGRDRCWLAGDAAHQTGPVGIQSMNLGLREAADLAAVLKKILRQGGSPDLFQAYEQAHRLQWRKLLGLDGGHCAPNAPAWVRENVARIVAGLPASGREFIQLLDWLGIQIN